MQNRTRAERRALGRRLPSRWGAGSGRPSFGHPTSSLGRLKDPSISSETPQFSLSPCREHAGSGSHPNRVRGTRHLRDRPKRRGEMGGGEAKPPEPQGPGRVRCASALHVRRPLSVCTQPQPCIEPGPGRQPGCALQLPHFRWVTLGLPPGGSGSTDGALAAATAVERL